MTTSREANGKHAWQRFTLLDLLLLFPGYSLGSAAVRWMATSSQQNYRVPKPWPADAMVVELLLAGLCVGSVLAGPIILGSHYICRGRRTRMSIGEWLWLAPIGIYLCAWSISWSELVIFGSTTPVWFMLFSLGQLMVSLLAFPVLCLRLVGHCEGATCFWTDCFGCVASILAGVLLAYTLAVDPSGI